MLAAGPVVEKRAEIQATRKSSMINCAYVFLASNVGDRWAADLCNYRAGDAIVIILSYNKPYLVPSLQK